MKNTTDPPHAPAPEEFVSGAGAWRQQGMPQGPIGKQDGNDYLAGPQPEVEAQNSQDLQANSPLEISPAGWRQTLKRTVKEVRDDRITLIAAGMAFYFFLAIFPALIAAVGILGLIDDSGNLVQQANDAIQSTIPGGAGEVLTDAVATAGKSSDKASLLAAVAGVATALWSASSGMVAMQSGLNVAYDGLPERKFIKKRLVAFTMLFAAAVLGGVPSPLFAFGDGLAFVILGWLVTVAAITTLFALFYFLGPNRNSPRWQWLTPGGIGGGLIWIAVSAGFGIYVDNFASYDKTYGPLAGVIILIFWLYLSALAILVGGELNAELERQASPT